ncbi:MAG: tetratricopeptide repeat protein [Ardenticatenia bacterium]|nr:tetratricopeptide repeat protein [Ardenticatenia bacterium]
MATRGVWICGDVHDNVVITGDGNQVLLCLSQEELFFSPLDPQARRDYRERGGATDFYDGTQPSWPDIAHGLDAPRALYTPLWDFLTRDDLPPQRMALILGQAGEGKSTLLMRLAWDLAEHAGYTVMYAHGGRVRATYRLPIAVETPLVLMVDQADHNAQTLFNLVRDLHREGLPVRLLAAARAHEWRRDAESRVHFSRHVHLRSFVLGRLRQDEARAILDKLERAGKLDRLASLPPERRVAYFLERDQADGQLLAAMLSARYQVEKFEEVICSVFQRVKTWSDGQMLVDGYTYLAAVHRFGLSLPRVALAMLLGVGEGEVGRRFIKRLEGEILAPKEQASLVRTRHPWIAERALAIVEEKGWAEEPQYVYARIFEALEATVRDTWGPWRRLLIQAPLAYSRAARWEVARSIFESASKVASHNPVVWQAWALLEARLGRHEEARRLFRQGVEADPGHAPVWQAWALLEARLGRRESGAGAASARGWRPTLRTRRPRRERGRCWRRGWGGTRRRSASSGRGGGRPCERAIQQAWSATGRAAGAARGGSAPLPAGGGGRPGPCAGVAGVGAAGGAAGAARGGAPLPAAGVERPTLRTRRPGRRGR